MFGYMWENLASQLLPINALKPDRVRKQMHDSGEEDKVVKENDVEVEEEEEVENMMVTGVMEKKGKVAKKEIEETKSRKDVPLIPAQHLLQFNQRIYGRNLRGPLELLADFGETEEKIMAIVFEWVNTLQKRSEMVTHIATDREITAKQKSRELKNQKSKLRCYEEESIVLRQAPGMRRKLKVG